MINPHPALPEFEYFRPSTLQEAVHFLQEHASDARPFLGGTDCLVALRDKKIQPAFLVDLKHIEGLKNLSFDQQIGLTIGAAVSMNELLALAEVQQHYPLLVQAARQVGSYQLRSRATAVGNICNASPCGDTIAPCLVYEGLLHIAGPDGDRKIPLLDFFTGPGQTILQTGEIVTSIQLPIPPTGTRGVYLPIGRNAVGDLALVAVTVLALPGAQQVSGWRFKIALTAVAPTVIFAEEAQRILAEGPLDEATFAKAAQAAGEACRPIDDIRASARYRREMIVSLTQTALQEVCAPH